MASAVSYEYLQSIRGATGGIASLGNDGKVPTSQLPPGLISVYKGVYNTAVDLNTAYPDGNTGDYAYVTADGMFYYWSSELDLWVQQEIEETDYLALSDAAKAAVPYLVIPDAPPTP
ncbi:MAG: hypothetical protein FWE40_10125 [Oscillospiraceae bacterium]|jgi:hypothetical protein|nr:hypothetical protein [Oscillospiraceae bacterium]